MGPKSSPASAQAASPRQQQQQIKKSLKYVVKTTFSAELGKIKDGTCASGGGATRSSSRGIQLSKLPSYALVDEASPSLDWWSFGVVLHPLPHRRFALSGESRRGSSRWPRSDARAGWLTWWSEDEQLINTHSMTTLPMGPRGTSLAAAPLSGDASKRPKSMAADVLLRGFFASRFRTQRSLAETLLGQAQDVKAAIARLEAGQLKLIIDIECQDHANDRHEYLRRLSVHLRGQATEVSTPTCFVVVLDEKRLVGLPICRPRTSKKKEDGDAVCRQLDFGMAGTEAEGCPFLPNQGNRIGVLFPEAVKKVTSKVKSKYPCSTRRTTCTPIVIEVNNYELAAKHVVPLMRIGVLTPNPYTLHPTPYTLHPTPYTLTVLRTLTLTPSP